METETYVSIYTAQLIYAFAVSALTLIGYSFLAPWWAHVIGRLVWTLLFSITLVLSLSFIRYVFGDFDYRRELFLLVFGLFNVALTFCGVSVYRVQIKGYLKHRIAIAEFNKDYKKRNENAGSE